MTTRGYKQPPVPAPQSAATPPLERLVAELSLGARSAVNVMLAGSIDAARWEELNDVIHKRVRAFADSDERRDIETAVITHAIADLHRREPERADAFAALAADLDGWRESWGRAVDQPVLEGYLFRALLWHAAWHMLAAGIPINRVFRTVAAVPAPIPKLPARATAAVVPPASQPEVAVASVVDIPEVKPVEPVAQVQSPPPTEPPTDAAASTTTVHALDAVRLRSSIFGTWLSLVLFSWLSLAWGGLLSLPFGVGIGVFATFIGGMVAVPLWGTVFGFLGMNAARSGTLSDLHYETVPDDHPLRASCASMAVRLGLPMPKLGTIGVFNAIAMGPSERDATVGIGRGLLEVMSPDEVDAVMGHELGHVISGDMRRMMLMRTFQNTLVWFGVFQGMKQFVRWILCWFTELSILSFSRSREYWADAIGAELTSKHAMIGALRKLNDGPPLTGAERTHARFMFHAGLLSTHPRTSERIAALENETYMRKLPRRVVG